MEELPRKKGRDNVILECEPIKMVDWTDPRKYKNDIPEWKIQKNGTWKTYGCGKW